MNRRHCLVVLAVTLLAVSAGCKTAAEKEAARAEKEKTKAEKEERKRKEEEAKFRTLGPDEIYVVGKIEIVPKIRREEQNLKTLGSGRLANKVYIFFSDKFVDVREQSLGIMKHGEEGTQEEVFVVKRKRSMPLYYSGAHLYLESSATTEYRGSIHSRSTTFNVNRLFMPGDLVYTLQPGDKAVYVGTLRYNRDAYNGVAKAVYINDYARANAKSQAQVKNPAIKLRQVPPTYKKGVW